MATDLETFVLSYKVESKDATKRIDELENKIKSSKTASDKLGTGIQGASKEIKTFATQAGEKIGSLVPGFGAVSSGIGGIVAAAGPAAVAIGVLALAIKSVTDLQEKFNTQRQVARQVGVSDYRVEEYERQVLKASNGRVTRPQVQENVLKFRDRLKEARLDVSGYEGNTRALRGSGVSGDFSDTNKSLTELATSMSKVSESTALARGRFLGLSDDFTLAIRSQGAAVGQYIEMTDSEIVARNLAMEKSAELVKVTAELTNSFGELWTTVGSSLIPVVTDVVKYVNELVTALFTLGEAVGNFTSSAIGKINDLLNDVTFGGWNKVTGAIGKALSSDTAHDMTLVGAAENTTKLLNAGTEAMKTPEQKESEEAQKRNAKEIVDKSDKQAAMTSRTTDNFSRAVSMFAGATASWTNAIDEQQAMAAWAGEIGRSAGIGTNSNAKGGGESKDLIQDRAVQVNIAQRLGIPVEQLQQGGASKGDVAFASSQLETGYQNNIAAKKRELAKPMLIATERARIMQEIRTQERGLQQMKQHSQAQVTKSKEGGRDITVGERAYVINVYSNGQDPASIGQEAQRGVMKANNHMINAVNDGRLT